MSFQLWLVLRYLGNRRRWLNPSTLLAVFGMALGVASLVVAMAVVSGFESALKQAIIDVAGDVTVIKSGGRVKPGDQLLDRLKKAAPEIEAATPFMQIEAVLAHNGKISGIMLQGIDPATVDQVLNLKPRLTEGKSELTDDLTLPPILVGRGVMSKLHLKLGDVIRVVMPNPSLANSTNFSPRLQQFRVQGVLDLGKYEYDERILVTTLAATQRLADFGDGFSGYRLRIRNNQRSGQVNVAINQALGYPYWVRDWQQMNQNLLEAVKLEKIVLFFVVLIMVIAASFNISSTLFVTVLRRYADISILRTMGASRRFILGLFSIQGLLVGLAGAVVGLFMGLGLCFAFMILETRYGLLPGQIYKLSRFSFELRWGDLLAIFSMSFLICFLSTLAPARRGAQLEAVEGLRYE